MGILLVGLLCTFIFLVCRGGDKAFGKGVGAIMSISFICALFFFPIIIGFIMISIVFIPVMLAVIIPLAILAGCMHIFKGKGKKRVHG